jgi:hypothetical protein
VVKVSLHRPATLIGGGAVETYRDLITENHIELVVIDAAVSPVQQRNLEQEWKCKVIDRTGLILEIFGERARTREGQLQVELAALTYQRSRLVRSWTHLERQRGGFGFIGGPGESQLEIDRRLIGERSSASSATLRCAPNPRFAPQGPAAGAPIPWLPGRLAPTPAKSTLFNWLTGQTPLAKDANRHSGPDHAGGEAAVGRGSSCPTPSVSSPNCRPIWSPPSVPRWKKCWRRTSSCMCATCPIPTRSCNSAMWRACCAISASASRWIAD